MYADVSINQVEIEPLERFKEAMEGRGRILGPYPHGEWKPMHRYTTRKLSDVNWIYANLGPHLCQPKREQMKKAIQQSNESRKVLGNNYILNAGECRRGHSSTHRTEHGQCRMCMRITDAKRRNGMTPEWIAAWETEGGVIYTGW